MYRQPNLKKFLAANGIHLETIIAKARRSDNEDLADAARRLGFGRSYECGTYQKDCELVIYEAFPDSPKLWEEDHNDKYSQLVDAVCLDAMLNTPEPAEA